MLGEKNIFVFSPEATKGCIEQNITNAIKCNAIYSKQLNKKSLKKCIMFKNHI